MKKLLALMLAGVMLACSLAGCGAASETPAPSNAGSTEKQTVESSTPASTASEATGEFDWKKFDGEEITVLFSEHTYADAVEEKLSEFTEKTGIKVNYSSMPEGNYFEKLNVELSSHSGSIDVFMTGAYQSWEYATAGNLEPLENFIDTDLTSPECQEEERFPRAVP